MKITYAALALAMSSVALAPPVGATDNMTWAYAQQFGTAICMTLSDFPTVYGAMGIGEAIVEDGLTPAQAGEIIYIAITDMCPEHLPILRAIIAQARMTA